MAKSLKQQLVDIQTKIDELLVKKAGIEAALANEVNEEHIVPGATVEFIYGKGEGKRLVSGTVVAVKKADPAVAKSADQVKVAIGEGFDAQFAVIYLSTISKVSAPASEEVAA